MISPWVKGSSAATFRHHRSIIVVVPEPRSLLEDDLGLSLGQLVLVVRAREPGDDLARDVDGNDPAESRLVIEMVIRSGFADRAATPIGAEQLRL